jgi:uncharacterized protein (DUF2235 family)
MKRIIICCDGTWNDPDDMDNNQSAPTNVFKMSRLISAEDSNKVQQIVYYHDGVGTGNAFNKFVGGAFGVGLSKNIEDAYKFLMNNYVDGDELYFFGFSRGAYTVRSLIGLIRNSGLLKKEHADKFSIAYELYRERSDATHPDSDFATSFKKNFCFEQTSIHFLGVWDTVGSLGVPDFVLSKLLGGLWNFHDIKLSSIVKNAYQAVAIDEQRGDFKPCLWTSSEAENVTQEQVRFAGVHADVGGGYYRSGLSDIALQWMMDKATACNLELNPSYHSVNGNFSDELHDSWIGFFKARPTYKRPIEPNDLIHFSVQQRINDKACNYTPTLCASPNFTTKPVPQSITGGTK